MKLVVALPPLSGAVASGEPLSVKATFPDGGVEAEEETVAVNVTVCPVTDGLDDEVTVVVVPTGGAG